MLRVRWAFRVAYSCLGYGTFESPSLFQRATGLEWDLTTSLGRHPEEWRPLDDEPVFSKPGWSATANTNFTTFLARNNIQQRYNNGRLCLTLAFARPALTSATMGIQSLIVGDAACGLTDAGHIYTNDAVTHGLVKIRTTGELLLLLKTLEHKGSILI